MLDLVTRRDRKWNRRGFMQVGALGWAGLTLPGYLAAKDAGRVHAAGERACILIFNVGGPSHLDTFDMKPAAPAEIRGPFRPIATRSAEFQVSELLPRHAQIADRFSLVRSCYHHGPAVHDVGWQMMQTGRYFSDGVGSPHAGAVAAYCAGRRKALPANIVLPTALGRGGGGLPNPQSGGYLGARYDPLVLSTHGTSTPDDAPLQEKVEQALRRMERTSADDGFQSAWQTLTQPAARRAFNLEHESSVQRDCYGRTRFGQSCLLARRLVEAGVRFVTINTFSSVYDEISWDIHGSAPFSGFGEMKRVVAPMYDRAYAALIEDLQQRGLLATTLVCNLCEFGRTPVINAAGGRDHWTQCFTVYFAGGGIQGGRAVGCSDAIGGSPEERPTEPAEILATIYRGLGLPANTRLPRPDGTRERLVDTQCNAIRELFE